MGYRVSVAVATPSESVKTTVVGGARTLVEMVVDSPLASVVVKTVGVDIGFGVEVIVVVSPFELVDVMISGVTKVGSGTIVETMLCIDVLV